jgi:hypothetical protein
MPESFQAAVKKIIIKIIIYNNIIIIIHIYVCVCVCIDIHIYMYIYIYIYIYLKLIELVPMLQTQLPAAVVLPSPDSRSNSTIFSAAPATNVFHVDLGYIEQRDSLLLTPLFVRNEQR